MCSEIDSGKDRTQISTSEARLEEPSETTAVKGFRAGCTSKWAVLYSKEETVTGRTSVVRTQDPGFKISEKCTNLNRYPAASSKKTSSDNATASETRSGSRKEAWVTTSSEEGGPSKLTIKLKT